MKLHGSDSACNNAKVQCDKLVISRGLETDRPITASLPSSGALSRDSFGEAKNQVLGLMAESHDSRDFPDTRCYAE